MKNARVFAGVLKKLQVLSSRIPPVRAVAVASNLYSLTLTCSHKYKGIGHLCLLGAGPAIAGPPKSCCLNENP